MESRQEGQFQGKEPALACRKGGKTLQGSRKERSGWRLRVGIAGGAGPVYVCILVALRREKKN